MKPSDWMVSAMQAMTLGAKNGLDAWVTNTMPIDDGSMDREDLTHFGV
jgi:hypothetical protein